MAKTEESREEYNLILLQHEQNYVTILIILSIQECRRRRLGDSILRQPQRMRKREESVVLEFPPETVTPNIKVTDNKLIQHTIVQKDRKSVV